MGSLAKRSLAGPLLATGQNHSAAPTAAISSRQASGITTRRARRRTPGRVAVLAGSRVSASMCHGPPAATSDLRLACPRLAHRRFDGRQPGARYAPRVTGLYRNPAENGSGTRLRLPAPGADGV